MFDFVARWPNKILLPGVLAIVLLGLFFIFDRDSRSNTSKNISPLIPSKISAVEEKALKELDTSSKKAMENDVNNFVDSLQSDVKKMHEEVALLEGELDYQQIIQEADIEIEKIAEEKGVTKNELLQAVEDEIFAPVSTPASIALDKEITAVEKKKEVLIERFKNFTAESEN